MKLRIACVLVAAIVWSSTAAAQAVGGRAGSDSPGMQALLDGRKALESDDFAAAEAKFREAISLDPKLNDAYWRLAAVLYSKDTTRKSANICYDDGGLDPYYKQLYLDEYVKCDPTTTAEFFATIEEPLGTADLIPYDEFLRTGHYREWARPQGLADHLRVALEKSGTSIAFFGVFRDQRQGLVDDEMRQRMRLVAPHVRRAMAIGSAMGRKTAEAAALADTLDGVSAGMFLVDANGRIVHANASGQALLDERSVLRAGSGKLAAIEAAADRELKQTLALAAGGDAAIGTKGSRCRSRRATASATSPTRCRSPRASGGGPAPATRPRPRCSCARRRWTLRLRPRPSPGSTS